MSEKEILNLQFRKATRDDLIILIEMLADDTFGKNWEIVSNPPDPRYLEAFLEIEADPKQEILILEDQRHQILGTIHLVQLRFMNHVGQKAVMFESVRIHSKHRSKGLGSIMIQMAIDRVKQQKIDIIQLTSNKLRTEAIRFYQKQGFSNSHEGLKLDLTTT